MDNKDFNKTNKIENSNPSEELTNNLSSKPIESEEEKDGLKPNYAILGGVGGAGVLGGGVYMAYQHYKDNDEVNVEPQNTDPSVSVDVIKDETGDIHIDIDVEKESLSAFELAFADARKAGLSEFTWNNSQYHTKTKEEMFLPSFNKNAEQDIVTNNLELRVTTIEHSHETVSQPKVASELLERDAISPTTVISDHNIAGSDTNSDGIIDTIVIDRNNDGKVDAMAIDENYDGVFEVFSTNNDQDSTLDTMIHDADANGPDMNDISEAVSLDIEMSEYNRIEDTSSNQDVIDTLENLF
jgi:hypothetical protein